MLCALVLKKKLKDTDELVLCCQIKAIFEWHDALSLQDLILAVVTSLDDTE